MDHRYLVAIPIPRQIRVLLDDLYHAATEKHLSIDHLHISLEFPFFLRDDFDEAALQHAIEHAIEGVPFFPFRAWLTRPGVFHQNHKSILFLTAEPMQQFIRLHDTVSSALEAFVHRDSSVYTRGVIPSYEPHVTLSYDTPNFDDVLQRMTNSPVITNLNFEAEHIEILKEVEKGVWVTMGSNH